ncbi:MAG: hypothetical protein ACTHZ7_14850 [Sphingobacterium sp.]
MRAQIANLVSPNFVDKLQTMRLSLAMVFSRAQRRYNPRRSTNRRPRSHEPERVPEDRSVLNPGLNTRHWQKGIENLDEDLFLPLSYYLDGYKIHQIAAYLQQSPSMVKQKIDDAKKALKEMQSPEISSD